MKYLAKSIILKFFSINSITVKLYRNICNILGNKKRLKLDLNQCGYITRSALFIDLIKKYNILGIGDEALELGTGWLHWYSIYLKLYVDVKISLFDVWDNRQFEACHVNLEKLRDSLTAENINGLNIKLLNSVLNSKNYDDVYGKLNLKYFIEPNGDLSIFNDLSFNCVFSFHVLEHIPADYNIAKEIHRLLKEGGYSLHQIGIDDHLAFGNKKRSPKEYLKYSDKTWKLFFENKVQYFNRIQMNEWLLMFEKAGFELIEIIPEYCDIAKLKVNKRFSKYSLQDLKCTTLTIVHRKK